MPRKMVENKANIKIPRHMNSIQDDIETIGETGKRGEGINIGRNRKERKDNDIRSRPPRI